MFKPIDDHIFMICYVYRFADHFIITIETGSMGYVCHKYLI